VVGITVGLGDAYNPRPMPSNRSRSEQERAEARRRARYAAQGKEPLPGTEPRPQAAVAAPGPAPGFLGRIFPPAPLLPGKGDPLAGFTYKGRFSGIVAGAWLLAHHPLAWGVPAVGWAVLQWLLLAMAQTSGNRQSLWAFGITLGQYGLLIGAGWVGWWRPWLFGAAAGVGGAAIHVIIAVGESIMHGPSVTIDVVFLSFATEALLYVLVGAFAGFYGGYLRRRMATPAQPAKGKRR
jgi:hypothetical protein